MNLELQNNLITNIRLPPKVEIIVFLIKAELKNEKFTDHLTQIGFDPSFCSLDLSSLILALIGFAKLHDELYDWYNKLVDHYIEKIDFENRKNIQEEAFNFYLDLVMKYRSEYNKVMG